jgi:ribosomal protein L32
MNKCNCRQCLLDRDERDFQGMPVTMTRMIVCSECGNKRCPHATNHIYACTDSNEPGQPGSVYA